MRTIRFLVAIAGVASALFNSTEGMAQVQAGASWEGLANVSGFVPPDTHGAVGPQGVLATVNGGIAYYDKNGNLIWGPLNINSAFFNFPQFRNGDPKALYDRHSGRFFVVMQANTSISLLYIAASKNSHPATASFSDWNFSVADMSLYGEETYGGDYPGLGVDDKALYVTYNMFSLGSGGELDDFFGSQILIFRKSSLFSGGEVSPAGSLFADGRTLQPATPTGPGSPGNRMFFAEVVRDSEDTVRLWTVDDPLGARLLDSDEIHVPDHGGSVNGAPQQGTTADVDTLDARAQSAFWLNGDVWLCHTAGKDSERAIVNWYRIRPQPGESLLIESGSIDGGPGIWTYMPAIGANYRGDIAMVFTRSADFMYPTMYYSLRPAGTGAFSASQSLRSSFGFNNTPIPPPRTSTRWGDYALVCADPANDTLWLAHEYVRSSGMSDWGTWWVNLRALHGDIHVNQTYTGRIENGTVANPFKAITSANISAYSSGETIRIFTGNYDERLTINKGVTLIAEGGPVTIGQ